ncbi:MAG: acetate--CoA ligase family protein [Chloroflexota bacterium]
MDAQTNMTVQKAAADLIKTALASGASALDEWQSKALFAAYGIPVPAGELVHSAKEAVTAAARIGGKVVMKGMGAEFHHKTEAGLVALNIDGPEAVMAAYRLLEQRGGVRLEAVLVEQMVVSNREFMVGMKRDPVFGPVVAFGLGGVLTEALGDVALAVAPVDDIDAAELPGLIRARKLLGSLRGYPPVDQAALAKIIQAIGEMALDNPEIAEIDVNPVLVSGAQPIAADALIVLSPIGAKEPEKPAFTPNFKALLAPRSMVLVGASGDISKWGGSAFKNVLDGGYTGRLYAANPKGGDVFDYQAYTSIDELPEAPDLALLAVGGQQVAPMLEQCARKKVRAAIAIAAGFSETGASGSEAEREIARIATEGGITLMGPNCMGLITNEVSLHAVGFVKLHPPKGTLSFISQSGNIGVTTSNACERRGIGIDKFTSVGNEAQIGAVDILDYLRDDPNTTCVMMYIEGLDDGRRFMEVARRATAVKPVVVLRTGLTEFGSKAAASHTGAMASSAAVWEAAARQSGVVTCTSVDEVVDLGTCMAYLPLRTGRRVAIITQGGGAGVIAADEVARHGLQLAELPAKLYASFDALLPPFWSRQNPLDLVASGGGNVMGKIVAGVAECDAVDAIIIMSVLGVPAITSGDREMSAHGEFVTLSAWEDSLMALIAELMEKTGKPIINVPDSPIRGSVFDYGRRYRPIVLSSARAAALALDRMEWYASYRRDHN